MDEEVCGQLKREQDIINYVMMTRSQSSSSSSSDSHLIDPMEKLKSVTDKIKHALDDDSLSDTRVIQSLAKGLEVDTSNSQIANTRRTLVKIITEFNKEAETKQFDLTPYDRKFESFAFIFWCITTRRANTAAQAQLEVEAPVNPRDPFADEAENQIDQDLMQLESGMFYVSLTEILLEYLITEMLSLCVTLLSLCA